MSKKSAKNTPKTVKAPKIVFEDDSEMDTSSDSDQDCKPGEYYYGNILPNTTSGNLLEIIVTGLLKFKTEDDPDASPDDLITILDKWIEKDSNLGGLTDESFLEEVYSLLEIEMN